MDSCNILQGILIGAGGGAAASIVILFFQFCNDKRLEYRDRKRIYQWLMKNTKDEENKRYRSTRTIASWSNLTEDRVRYICNLHEKIYLSTGNTEDVWGVYGISGRKALG